MAGENKGKQFESVIYACFSRVPDVSIDRLRDAPKKLKGVDNPSDFIVYKKPHEVYVECKSHKGKSLPLSCIRYEQIQGLLRKSKIEGVKCGLLIWYRDLDLTVWLDIDTVIAIKNTGVKSINYRAALEYPHIELQGKKKRVYFDYDMEEFLEELYGI